MPEKKVNKYSRKVFRVGGSVVVPLPKKLRRDLGIGIGEYVSIVAVNEHSILIKKEGKKWDGTIKIRD